MKICISSTGDNLDSGLDSRFGRCQYFIFSDSETLDFEAVQNSYKDAGGGVGIQAGQLVAEKQAEVVITGNVGPNAFRTLQAAGIEIITGASGSIKEVIEKYNKGELKKKGGPTVGRKFGMS